MNPQELQNLLKILPTLPEAQLRDLYASLEEHEQIKKRENAANNFMDFVHKVWPTFIDGAHHARMARAFEKVARGECRSCGAGAMSQFVEVGGGNLGHVEPTHATTETRSESDASRFTCVTPRYAVFSECPHCGSALYAEHAHFRCAGCGWRDSCCD